MSILQPSIPYERGSWDMVSAYIYLHSPRFPCFLFKYQGREDCSSTITSMFFAWLYNWLVGWLESWTKSGQGALTPTYLYLVKLSIGRGCKPTRSAKNRQRQQKRKLTELWEIKGIHSTHHSSYAKNKQNWKKKSKTTSIHENYD